jgi:AbrB family looped-hinge helix DNA binding protein
MGVSMQTVKVLGKGQIVIPAALRNKYRIKPGSKLQIFEYAKMIYLIPPDADPIENAMGCLPARPSLTEELLNERKKDFPI